VAGLMLAHVLTDETPDSSGLLSPVSKTGSRGTGARRFLRCTCIGAFSPLCPVHALRAHHEETCALTGVPAGSHAAWSTPLFSTVAGGTPSKAAVVAAWTKLAPAEVAPSGHTARRSGAKARAREGWSVLAIQHLGRWASNAVLSYVEDALAETPHGHGLDASESAVVPEWHARVASLEERMGRLVEASGPPPPSRIEAEGDLAREAACDRPTDLLVVALPARKAHIRASASLCAPSWAWSTLCGWRFAGSASFCLLSPEQATLDNTPRCRKCFKGEGEAGAAGPGAR